VEAHTFYLQLFCLMQGVYIAFQSQDREVVQLPKGFWEEPDDARDAPMFLRWSVSPRHCVRIESVSPCVTCQEDGEYARRSVVVSYRNRNDPGDIVKCTCRLFLEGSEIFSIRAEVRDANSPENVPTRSIQTTQPGAASSTARMWSTLPSVALCRRSRM
jgi:hypothetical protein